jgi:hypothetical protein
MIKWANGSGARIIALDLPSGLDATSGARPGECIHVSCIVHHLLVSFVTIAFRGGIGIMYLNTWSTKSRSTSCPNCSW